MKIAGLRVLLVSAVLGGLVALLVLRLTGGAQQPRRIVLQSVFPDRVVEGTLVRTGADAWTWTEGQFAYHFTGKSESTGVLLLFDASRNMYHRLDLASRSTEWRIGDHGPWNPSCTIAAVE